MKGSYAESGRSIAVNYGPLEFVVAPGQPGFILALFLHALDRIPHPDKFSDYLEKNLIEIHLLQPTRQLKKLLAARQAIAEHESTCDLPDSS